MYKSTPPSDTKKSFIDIPRQEPWHDPRQLHIEKIRSARIPPRVALEMLNHPMSTPKHPEFLAAALLTAGFPELASDILRATEAAGRTPQGTDPASQAYRAKDNQITGERLLDIGSRLWTIKHNVERDCARETQQSHDRSSESTPDNDPSPD